MIDYSIILTEFYADKSWSINGIDYEGIDWLDDSPQPSQPELDALWDDANYEFELNIVKNARHAAYTAPNGSDAIFMKYQRGEATEQEWLDAVQAINDAHPYPVKK